MYLDAISQRTYDVSPNRPPDPLRLGWPGLHEGHTSNWWVQYDGTHDLGLQNSSSICQANWYPSKRRLAPIFLPESWPFKNWKKGVNWNTKCMSKMYLNLTRFSTVTRISKRCLITPLNFLGYWSQNKKLSEINLPI